MDSQSSVITVPDLPVYRRGKVRDTYELPGGQHLLMVASDRISAFDVILPSLIPGKGCVLTRLSTFWFEQTRGLIPNHLVAAGTPHDLAIEPERIADLEGRTVVVRRAERIDIECVVRGYLAGSAWEEYERTGYVAGQSLPPDLERAAKLPAPVFTPAIKNDDEHDVTISPARLTGLVGTELATRLEAVSRRLYGLASDYAAERGIILADTKFEFGLIDGELTLIDEALTPDSSRFWDAATWTPGTEPASFDKQYVRNWLLTTDWNREAPAPALPEDVVAGTVERYHEAYRRLTGRALKETV